ncbi:chemotaxis-specific protein-glutamate methyltransferase CheB [Leptospira inadai]
MASSVEPKNQRKRITVFAVDDSLIYRNLLRSAIMSEPEFEFVGAAIDGIFALPKISYLKPDFVVMDVEMPQMNGLDALAEIKKSNPETRVIMFSSLTSEGAKTTLQALDMGALDFVAKPSHMTKGNAGINETLGLLSDKIKAIYAQELVRFQDRKIGTLSGESELKPKRKFNICGIGISTGGPAALRELLSKLKPDLRGIIIIAQHMPSGFTKYLAENLTASSDFIVKEVSDGEILEEGSIYVAPGGMQLEVIRDKRGVIGKVYQGPLQELCKPSVNILFNSLAENFSNESVGVIMTGMGEDGYLGMKKMKENGAYLIAQSKETCLVYGMPNKPVKEGIVNEVLSIDSIAERISNFLSKDLT